MMREWVNLTKIGRNEPCPCGSGKKYKKCCLIVKEQNRFLRKSLDNLFEAKEQLINHVNFMNIFPHHVNKFYGLPNIRALDEAFSTYIEWHLLNYEDDNEHIESEHIESEEVESNGTFFDRFFSTHIPINSYTDEERKAMESWKYNKPSVYRVDEVDQIDTQRPSIKATDIFSGQKCLIDLRGMELAEQDISLGDLHETIIIATLLQTPIEGEFLPFININLLPGSAEEELQKMVNEAQNAYVKDELFSIIGGFYSLYESLQLEMIDNFIEEEMDFEKEIYQEAAQIFIEKMKESPLHSSDSISFAVETWFYYANDEMPNLKKANSVAAALEYLAAKKEVDAPIRKISQKELAKKYSTSSQTIAKYYDLLNEYIEEEMEDYLETVMDEDLAGDFDLDEDTTDLMENDMNLSEVENLLEILDLETSPEKSFNLAVQATEVDIDLAMGLFEAVIEILEDSHEDSQGDSSKYSESIYLRSKLYLALLHREKGNAEFAIEELYNISNLNCEKYFDVNSFLIPLLLSESRIEEAEKAISKYKEYEYKEDSSIGYSELLIHFLRYGFGDKEYFNELLKKAHNSNPYVVNYLKEPENISHIFPKEDIDKDKTRMDAEWFLTLTDNLWNSNPELTDYVIKTCAQHQYNLDDYF